MVGQTQECERAWVGDFGCLIGHLILRNFPAKISNSILMIFLSSVVARWGPKSAQIEKHEIETLLVGPFHIGFKGKKWVLGIFRISPPNRSDDDRSSIEGMSSSPMTAMRLSWQHER